MSATFGYQAFGYTQPVPNVADYTAILNSEVGITPAETTAIAGQLTATLAYAVHWVYKRLQRIDNCIYLRAVYCLATDRLINYGQDAAGFTALASLRKTLSTGTFIPGVISSSFDEGTGQSFQIADTLSSLTLADLQNLSTPWGREYLGYAQQGAPIWGLS